MPIPLGKTRLTMPRVLEANVPLALEIIADIIQNSTFDEGELAREREVILQEIGQAFDTPDDIIFDYFQETAFPQHSLGRPILGRPEIIHKISRKDLKDYMEPGIYGASYGLCSNRCREP